MGFPIRHRIAMVTLIVSLTRRQLLYSLCLVALTLSSCALQPRALREDQRPVVPAGWSEKTTDAESTDGKTSPRVTMPVAADALQGWWARFDDPLLSQLVEQSLRFNTSVKRARASLEKSRALRDVSAAALWPSLGVSASAGPSKTGSNPRINTYNAGFDASWELDIFGVNRSALNASNADALASASTLGNIQIAVAAEVALSYIALRNAQARLAIALSNLASQQDTLQITRWRLEAGLVSSLEAEQARAAAAQTSALIPALQTTIEQTQHAIAVLVGQPPATLSSLLSPIQPMPQAPDTLALSLPAETLRQRPDVRAAEHQIHAAQARVSQASAARLPDFSLSGSLGLTATRIASVSSGSTLISTLIAVVSAPLFDGGGLRAQVRVQEAALDEALFAYQATVLAALTDVEDALTALRGDRERFVRLQQAADAASNAALMARQRFSSGLVDFQVVLETQRTQLTTQDTLAITRADVSADHVRLYKALGGGWLPDSEISLAARERGSSQPQTP